MYLAGALVIFWCLVQYGLRTIYSDNPGVNAETHFFENVRTLLSWKSYLNFGAFFEPRGMNILLWGGTIVAVVCGWKRSKQGFPKIGVYVFGVLFVLALFCGVMEEIRMYYEAWPLLYCLVVRGILEA